MLVAVRTRDHGMAGPLRSLSRTLTRSLGRLPGWLQLPPNWRPQFRPKLLDHLSNYNRQTLVADASAGLTVAFVALPLALAFAIASGLPPETGLITAIIAGFLISALGGSSVQIGGPAGAFIVVVYAIVERYGIPNLLIATACAGLLMILMGLLRMGNLIRLVPISIVTGFTSGIAVLIALSQIKAFLGLDGPALPAEFFSKMQALAQALPSFDLLTFGLGLACLAVILLWPKSYNPQPTMVGRIVSRLPGTLMAIVGSTLLVAVLNLPVDTVGSVFGEIPRGLPAPSLPDFNWSTVQFLFAPILTIALLGAMESLLCARVADGLAKERHDPNQELMAQGAANIVSPLFGGFCATGTVARTVTNIRSGAKTPVSGMVHALVLLAIVLGAAPLAEQIPLVALAAVAFVVAYNMGEWRAFKEMKAYSLAYRATLLSTFVLTIVVDITVAVEVGLVMACAVFIYRMSQITRVEVVGEAEDGIEVRRLTGVLFFGAVSRLEHLLDPKLPLEPIQVFDLSSLLSVDSSGLDALKHLDAHLAGRDVTMRLACVRPEVLATMTRLGFVQSFGQHRMFETLAAGIAGHAEEAALEGTLSEWSSREDDQAYRNL
jgi:sulfate permease, SulP family